MVFWIAALFLTLVCVALLVASFRTPPDASAPDLEVYRDQLAELDRDAARGIIAPQEADATRTEVARRLLAADAAAKTQTAGWQGNITIGAGLAAVLVIGVTGATYWRLGAPGYGDMPLASRIGAIEAQRAARVGQAVAEAQVPDQIDESRPEVTQLAAQLRDVLQSRPDDLRGWRLAVETENGLGNMEMAWRAQNRVVAILGDEATAADFALLAELMIVAGGGYISPEAESALARALELDPRNGTARYFTGLMYAQGGRPDLAWPIWRRLVGDSQPDAPWLPPIYSQIEAISVAAGDPTPVEQLARPRGPTEADVAAMGELTLEERMDQIGGMIESLSARLAADGGPPRDWAQLITSYGVVGRTDAASIVYEEAKLLFADDPAALDILAAGADRAGLAP